VIDRSKFGDRPSVSVRLLYGLFESLFDSLWIAADSLCEGRHLWAFGFNSEEV